jgi:RHS repeat-associated protein
MSQGYTPEGYTMTMTYDAENRLISAQFTDNSSVIHRTEYSYSGDDLLAEIKKLSNGTPVSDTRYVMAGFLPVQERDGSNNVVRQYTWGLNYGGGIGGLLNLRQNSNDYSYLYDGKGNITTLIDGSQNVVATYAYDPFGTLIQKTGSLNQPYMFSTKEYDEETGLSYYGYRFYSPTIGRWTTRDPIGEEGGINLYGFVGNDPVHYVDPKGKGPILFGVCFATTVADAIDRGHEISEALDKRAELRKEKEKRVRQCEDPTLPADRQQLIRDRIDAIDKEILKLGHETAVSGLWGVGKLFGLTFLCGLALTP